MFAHALPPLTHLSLLVEPQACNLLTPQAPDGAAQPEHHRATASTNGSPIATAAAHAREPTTASRTLPWAPFCGGVGAEVLLLAVSSSTA